MHTFMRILVHVPFSVLVTSLYDVPIPGVVRVCKMIARSRRSSLIRRRDHEAVKTSEVRTCYLA